MGPDLVVRVEGGASHIGALALAEPFERDGRIQASVSLLCRKGHREDDIAREYARRACEKTGTCALAVVGIHYDAFDGAKLKEVLDWVKGDLAALEEELGGR